MAGYDIGVRSRLNKEGVSNDRISYDQTNGVMVDSKSFMKPSKVYQGTAYTDNTGFNKAWDTFNKAQQPPAPIVQPTPNYGKTPEVTQQYDSYAQTYKNPETTERISKTSIPIVPADMRQLKHRRNGRRKQIHAQHKRHTEAQGLDVLQDLVSVWLASTMLLQSIY